MPHLDDGQAIEPDHPVVVVAVDAGQALERLGDPRRCESHIGGELGVSDGGAERELADEAERDALVGRVELGHGGGELLGEFFHVRGVFSDVGRICHFVGVSPPRSGRLADVAAARSDGEPWPLSRSRAGACAQH